MSTCISKHVIATIKDSETVSLFKFTLGLSNKHMKKIESIHKDLPRQM